MKLSIALLLPFVAIVLANVRTIPDPYAVQCLTSVHSPHPRFYLRTAPSSCFATVEQAKSIRARLKDTPATGNVDLRSSDPATQPMRPARPTVPATFSVLNQVNQLEKQVGYMVEDKRALPREIEHPKYHTMCCGDVYGMSE
ncbi:hypothetical protein FB451DRAFT_1365500 [Mycena latifolia]|nr:hypothetical protein FB451DRAFT_1365500 [Mycena latifolia]